MKKFLLICLVAGSCGAAGNSSKAGCNAQFLQESRAFDHYMKHVNLPASYMKLNNEQGMLLDHDNDLVQGIEMTYSSSRFTCQDLKVFEKAVSNVKRLTKVKK